MRDELASWQRPRQTRQGIAEWFRREPAVHEQVRPSSPRSIAEVEHDSLDAAYAAASAEARAEVARLSAEYERAQAACAADGLTLDDVTDDEAYGAAYDAALAAAQRHHPDTDHWAHVEWAQSIADHLCGSIAGG